MVDSCEAVPASIGANGTHGFAGRSSSSGAPYGGSNKVWYGQPSLPAKAGAVPGSTLRPAEFPTSHLFCSVMYKGSLGVHLCASFLQGCSKIHMTQIH